MVVLLQEASELREMGLVLTRSCSAHRERVAPMFEPGSLGELPELLGVAGLRPDASPAPEDVPSALHGVRVRASARVRGGRSQGHAAQRLARPKRRDARDRPANPRSGGTLAVTNNGPRTNVRCRELRANSCVRRSRHAGLLGVPSATSSILGGRSGLGGLCESDAIRSRSVRENN